MQLMTILSIQIFLMLCGSLVVHAIGVKKRLEVLGLSYLFGSVIVTFVFFLFHWILNLKLDKINFFLSVLVIILVSFFVIIIRKKQSFLLDFFNIEKINFDFKLGTTERVLFGLIIFLVGYSFFENYFWPITDWDALAFYDFRARVMALNGDMIEGIKLGYFFQYPPYTSFLHVFGYIFEAERVKVVYSFIYASMLLTFYNLLSEKQGKFVSLLFTLILASTPIIFEHSVTAYSNLSYTAFFSLGLIYLWKYYDDSLLKNMIIGSFLVGASSWIRSTETFWLIPIVLLIAKMIKNKNNIIMTFLGIFWINIPNRIWRLFLSDLNTKSSIVITDTQSDSTSFILDFFAKKWGVLELFFQTFEVIKFLVINLSSDYSLLLILLFLVFFNSGRKNTHQFLSLLGLLIIVIGGTFIFSFTFATWNLIGGSVVRMSMIFIPLILYVVGSNLKIRNSF